MRRRALLVTLPALTLVRGVSAQTKRARLAIVSPAISTGQMNQAAGGLFAGVLGELRRLGYAEGETLLVERYSVDGHSERLPAIVRDVVASQPDCILAQSSETAIPFKAATTTIPIVAYANNPVDHGLIATFARPGGNVTGFAASPGAQIVGKRLQFLHEAAPKATRIGFLSSKDEWERSLAPAVDQIQQGAPAGDHPWRLAVRRGGLMSYGVDTLASGAGLGDYIARILKGANPADLPYQQPTQFELVLNLVAARQLRLKFPQSLLARADEALE